MPLPRLQITPNRRYLQTEDGKPFFYLADTVWELFHRTTREEVDLLVRNRAAKGFTALQAVALAELDGLRVPNSYGHLPCENLDPLRPVEAYWAHVDWTIRRANEAGLYVALLPVWGDKWNLMWGLGPIVFHAENARAYGRWIGRRYRDAGIIWVLGGDRSLRDEKDLLLIRAMAEGIREGDGGTHLMTFHPPGLQSSSKFVHNESWLDFHMLQTGHDRSRASWMLTEHDFEMLPVRPVVNGEPPYEAHANAFQGGDTGWLDQIDIRRELHWHIATGGAGFAYGVHSIWQLWDGKREPINAPIDPWQDSLDLPGAQQVQFGKRLFLSRPLDRRPDNSFLGWPVPPGAEGVRILRGVDCSWLWAYLPNGQRVHLDIKGRLSVPRLHLRWLNPRNGAVVDRGLIERTDRLTLSPPFDPHGRDWVLLLDDPAFGYPDPR